MQKGENISAGNEYSEVCGVERLRFQEVKIAVKRPGK